MGCIPRDTVCKGAVIIIPYVLKRSARKSIALYITKDAALEVRAPLRVSRAQIDAIVAAKETWVRTRLAAQVTRNAAPRLPDDVRAALERERHAAARAHIPARVAHFAAQMGVTPAAIRINGAKTRWGSCSGKNTLNFSWRLMMVAPDLLDYVAVHELAHIREHNHSPRFWAVVAAVLPDYERRRAALRAAGRRLLDEGWD